MAWILLGKGQLHLHDAESRVYGLPIWYWLLLQRQTGETKIKLAWLAFTIRICDPQPQSWTPAFFSTFVSFPDCLYMSTHWPSNKLRLALVFVLKGRCRDFIAWFGIKCSSFIGINAGTSKRSKCSSVGNTNAPSVVQSNGMLERTNQPALLSEN